MQLYVDETSFSPTTLTDYLRFVEFACILKAVHFLQVLSYRSGVLFQSLYTDMQPFASSKSQL